MFNLRFMSDNKGSQKHIINVRINDLLYENLLFAIGKLNLTKTQLVNLALLKMFSDLDRDDFVLDGQIDLLELAKIKYLQEKRELLKIKRKNLMSKHLFMSNVERNIYLYIYKKRSKKEIMQLLRLYEEEASLYIDPKDLDKEFKEYFKNLVNDKSKLDNMQYKVMANLNNNINNDLIEDIR